jgi:lipoteichoic acid synthase
MNGMRYSEVIPGLKKVSMFAVLTFLFLAIKSLFVRDEIVGSLNVAGSIIEVSFLLLMFLFITFFEKKTFFFLYIVLNIFGSLFLLTSLFYFDYYNSIFTYKSIAQAGQVGEIRTSIYALFKIKYLWLFADFPILFLFWRKLKNLKRKPIQIRKKVFFIILAADATLITWGFYKSSQMISETSQYNTLGFFAYQLMEASSETGILFRDKTNITPELITSKKPSTLNDDIQLRGIAKNKNLIIVQLESVQNFLLNKRIKGVEITPNLNHFINESFYFPNFYTQVGKGNTSDAELLVNTSIYALGNEPMSSVTTGKEIPSLPRRLKEAGYYTATFHANEISFWSRKEMYEALGFEQYFDQDFFGKEDFIAYGVSDEILYKKTVEKLLEQKDKKFYAHIIALSSHYPYNLPETKSRYTITLPDSYNNSIVGAYIKSVSYADYAFGVLVQELKSSGLYNDSIIVVYGDHQGVQTQNEKDTALVNELLGRDYHSILDHLNVPLIVKIPSKSEGNTINTVGGLVDVYPTIANLLGIDINKDILFGTDLINAETNTIGIRFYAPTGTFVTNKYAFSPGETKNRGQLTYISDRQQSIATDKSLEELEQIIEYMRLSDEYVRNLE